MGSSFGGITGIPAIDDTSYVVPATPYGISSLPKVRLRLSVWFIEDVSSEYLDQYMGIPSSTKMTSHTLRWRACLGQAWI